MTGRSQRPKSMLHERHALPPRANRPPTVIRPLRPPCSYAPTRTRMESLPARNMMPPSRRSADARRTATGEQGRPREASDRLGAGRFECFVAAAAARLLRRQRGCADLAITPLRLDHVIAGDRERRALADVLQLVVAG